MRRELVGKGQVESDRIYKRWALKNVVEGPGAYTKLVGTKLIRACFRREVA